MITDEVPPIHCAAGVKIIAIQGLDSYLLDKGPTVVFLFPTTDGEIFVASHSLAGTFDGAPLWAGTSGANSAFVGNVSGDSDNSDDGRKLLPPSKLGGCTAFSCGWPRDLS